MVFACMAGGIPLGLGTDTFLLWQPIGRYVLRAGSEVLVHQQDVVTCYDTLEYYELAIARERTKTKHYETNFARPDLV